MAKAPEYTLAERCYYCGQGPGGEFTLVGGEPCCDGCLDDSEEHARSFDPAGGDELAADL